jgi:hypothetical protein
LLSPSAPVLIQPNDAAVVTISHGSEAILAKKCPMELSLLDSPHILLPNPQPNDLAVVCAARMGGARSGDAICLIDCEYADALVFHHVRLPQEPRCSHLIAEMDGKANGTTQKLVPIQ